jgi:hypothetical protein
LIITNISGKHAAFIFKAEENGGITFIQNADNILPDCTLSDSRRHHCTNFRCDKHKILKITGFLDYVFHPAFLKLENTMFQKLDLFPSSGE